MDMMKDGGQFDDAARAARNHFDKPFIHLWRGSAVEQKMLRVRVLYWFQVKGPNFHSYFMEKELVLSKEV